MSLTERITKYGRTEALRQLLEQGNGGPVTGYGEGDFVALLGAGAMFFFAGLGILTGALPFGFLFLASVAIFWIGAHS